MEWKTHIAGGAVAGAVILTSTTLQTMGVEKTPWYLHPAILALAVAGGLFPDVDLKSSKAGQLAGAASWITQTLWGHRTLFHSPELYWFIYLMLEHRVGNFAVLLLGFTAGAVSHLALDMLNAKGIPLFYPLPGHYHAATIKTGGIIERRICNALSILFLVIMGRIILIHII